MDELKSKIFWHLLPQCSNSALLYLQNKFGELPNPLDILHDSDEALPEPLLHNIRAALNNSDGRLESAADYIHDQQIGLLERGTPNYPPLLSQIPDPPALLYFRGSASILNRPQIAVVGSRASSRSGQRDAYSFASQLSASGFAITSGLALGIDAAAHSGALAASGLTIAVIGSGLDKIYPSEPGHSHAYFGRWWHGAQRVSSRDAAAKRELPTKKPHY